MADELYVSRLVSEGVILKAVKHARFALGRGDVERVSLERYRPGRTHPYWSTRREVATLLSVSRTRVNHLVRKGFFPP